MTPARERRRRGTRPYRRYRPIPALLLLALLGTLSGYVWVEALDEDTDLEEAVRCDPPADAVLPEPTAEVDYAALDDIEPAPPEEIRVRVLNASETRGRAALATNALRELGFTQVSDPANDEAYAETSAQCRGQLRYGPGGQREARTLSILDPCLELIEDGRSDTSVDFVLGAEFDRLRARTDAQTTLNRLEEQAEGAEAEQQPPAAPRSGPC